MNTKILKSFLESVKTKNFDLFDSLTNTINDMFHNYQQYNADKTYYTAISEILNSDDVDVIENAKHMGITIERLQLNQPWLIVYIESFGIKIKGVNL